MIYTLNECQNWVPLDHSTRHTAPISRHTVFLSLTRFEMHQSRHRLAWQQLSIREYWFGWKLNDRWKIIDDSFSVGFLNFNIMSQPIDFRLVRLKWILKWDTDMKCVCGLRYVFVNLENWTLTIQKRWSAHIMFWWCVAQKIGLTVANWVNWHFHP